MQVVGAVLPRFAPVEDHVLKPVIIGQQVGEQTHRAAVAVDEGVTGHQSVMGVGQQRGHFFHCGRGLEPALAVTQLVDEFIEHLRDSSCWGRQVRAHIRHLAPVPGPVVEVGERAPVQVLQQPNGDVNRVLKFLEQVAFGPGEVI